jgi:hypothetical protein
MDENAGSWLWQTGSKGSLWRDPRAKSTASVGGGGGTTPARNLLLKCRTGVKSALDE